MIVAAIASERLTVTMVAALLFKEVIIGLVIGLVLGVPIWAAEAAGDVLDLQRGSTAAGLLDPLATTEESITGTLFGLVMVALYFGSGGLPLTLRTVYDSYGIWPVASAFPSLGPAAGGFFFPPLHKLLTLGRGLVPPLVGFLLLA